MVLLLPVILGRTQRLRKVVTTNLILHRLRRLRGTPGSGAAMLVPVGPRTVEVICYSGYAADEEPRAVVVDGRRLQVVAVERRWQEPEARCFVVRISDGTRFLLRQDVTSSAWTGRTT